MLIRSQDKLMLIEFPRSISIIDSRKFPGSCFVDTATETLGIYSSKEKAMKVLNMIEAKYLEPTYINKVGMYQHDNYEYKVFQMPQDEEVIV